MKKTATPAPEKATPKKTSSKKNGSGVGAHGSQSKPKTGEGGGKWPGGGKKGEDE